MSVAGRQLGLVLVPVLLVLKLLEGEPVLAMLQRTARADLLPFAVSWEGNPRCEIDVRPAETYLMWKVRLDDQHGLSKALWTGLCCRHCSALTGDPFGIVATVTNSVMLTRELH